MRRRMMLAAPGLILPWRRAFAQGGMMPGPGTPHNTAPAYTGIGDVASSLISSAAFYGDLRAYTGAIAVAGTQKLINISRSSDNATADVLVASNGGLGLTANASAGSNGVNVATWGGASTFLVNRLYDQTGQGRDATAAGSARPSLVLTALSGGTLPAMQFSGSQFMLSTTGGSTNQPIFVACMAERTGNFTSYGGIVAFDGSGMQPSLFYDNAANTINIYGGTGGADGNAGVNVTANDSVLHSLAALFSGASSVINVDGTETAASIGTSATNTNSEIGAGGGNNGLIGYMTGWGWWGASPNSTLRNAIVANNTAYW